MKTTIDFDQMEKDAVEIFTSGFACSESVIWTIRKHFELDIPDAAIAMSSGFPWGLGAAGCICGALAGGTMCLGFLYGRTTPGDMKVVRCFELSNELHDKFKNQFGAACCRVLIRNYPDRNSDDRKAHCIEMVKFVVKAVAEIIIREETATQE